MAILAAENTQLMQDNIRINEDFLELENQRN